MYGRLVKVVVDVQERVFVVDSELYADEEFFLLERGSLQENLWGINLHPGRFGFEDFIEFDSMINLRPAQGNITRGVDSPFIQGLIRSIIAEKVVA